MRLYAITLEYLLLMKYQWISRDLRQGPPEFPPQIALRRTGQRQIVVVPGQKGVALVESSFPQNRVAVAGPLVTDQIGRLALVASTTENCPKRPSVARKNCSHASSESPRRPTPSSLLRRGTPCMDEYGGRVGALGEEATGAAFFPKLPRCGHAGDKWCSLLRK